MSGNYSDPLRQDPSSTPQPIPGQNAQNINNSEEPTLEEVAAQIKAVNSATLDPQSSSTPPVDPLTPPIIPKILTPAPAPEAVPSVPDAVSQLDDLPTPSPTPPANPGIKIADVLAKNEVIGENQISDVAGVLTPELISELVGQGSNFAATVPVTYQNSDGTALNIQVQTKDIFEFLAGRTDIVTASK